MEEPKNQIALYDVTPLCFKNVIKREYENLRSQIATLKNYSNWESQFVIPKL